MFGQLFQRARPRNIFLTTTIFAIFLLTGYGLVVEFVRDDASRITITDTLSLIYNLLATAAVFVAAKQSARISKRLTLGWELLAVAQLCIFLGDALGMFFEVVLKITSYPSLADLFHFLFYPIFFAGILAFPARQQSRFDWLKKTLDICIVLTAAMIGFWNFLIAPVIQAAAGASFLEQFLSVAYPVCDLMLLYAVLMILYQRSQDAVPGALWILVFGSIVRIVTDCIFSYQTLVGSYASGGLLDAGWITAYLLTGLAGVLHSLKARVYRVDDTIPFKVILLRERISTILSFMPYGWLLAAFLLLVGSHYSSTPMSFLSLSAGVGIIIVFVLLRQIIDSNEIKQILTNLRKALDQVNRQAFELDVSNQKLQQEIYDRERIEQQLAYDALHDGLTGLPNRTLFMDRLEHAVESTKRDSRFFYSVLFLDVDQFKVINDSLGHSAGDYLLVEIGMRLKNCVRSFDTVARFGGDEFVMLLEEMADKDVAIHVANRIQTQLQQAFNYKGQDVYITCSIGIVSDRGDFTNSEDILRDADIAMYWAKATGRARYEIFTSDLRQAALARMEVENDLRQAIVNGELRLSYQPIFSLGDNLMIGFEALVRWQHPKRGLLMPAEFISIAEETGLIIQIGDWVLYNACAQLKKWQTQYRNLERLSININVSAKQLSQIDFIDKVKEVLAITGVNPNRLNLEITENVMVNSQSTANDIFIKLSELGVKFQIDDFGTGYSSLAYLQRFPLHTIKIDKSFVQEMMNSKKGYELIKTIILMARDLGLETIAEGVENEEQLLQLKSLMCEYGQGYLLSRPVTADKIEELLNQQGEQLRGPDLFPLTSTSPRPANPT